MSRPVAKLAGTAWLIAAFLASPAHATLVYSTSDGIFVANDDGSAPRALSDDGEGPSITPDGRYVQWTQDGHIVVSTVDGTTARRTLPRGYRPPQERAAWTGRDEVLTDHRSGSEHRLVTIAFDPVTGARRQVAAGSLTFNASASPDGSRLALERGHGLGDRRPARHAIVVAGRTVARGTRPVWGPGGIAYVKPPGDLEVITPAGQVVRRVHRDHKVVWPVAWLDDGRLLAAAAREYSWRGTPGTQALLVDATGTATPLPGRYSGVFGIKADGSALLALDESGAAVAVALADGRRTALFDGTVDDIAWSR
ncbi:hypothetical protein OM076_08475 [Solirubrobacter ginsenosidimutans]|uniref:WD40 repeat domain-containing protein n=1 Tax=Solirubrobacter ginsenosidimutans TaxID=490573 RepID=A0A9X3MPA3_9ACTN|nr:hypothetical protein [Solirubrobacter ginsenosidimutans]MDA0160296.1 hypothetical protein [Solirubrobacter ginsenosidimutans]